MKAFSDNRIPSSAVIAVGLVLGLCCMGGLLKAGIDNFVNKDRAVTVKGLSEMEVKANHVTWGITTKFVGNDVHALSLKINNDKETILSFLKKNGLQDTDIAVNPPAIYDKATDRWGNRENPYRYFATLSMTVSTEKVDAVRDIANKIGELLESGIVLCEPEYGESIDYDFVNFMDMKPKMMEEAIKNAEITAQQFAKNSHSEIDKIVDADQGQFSIENRDATTPHIKKLRVVTTITCSLKD